MKITSLHNHDPWDERMTVQVNNNNGLSNIVILEFLLIRFGNLCVSLSLCDGM